MGLRYYTFIVGAIVMTLGLVLYYTRWSDRAPSPWEHKKHVGLMMKMPPAGLAHETEDRNHRKMPAEILEMYRPSLARCVQSAGSRDAALLSHGPLILESKNPCWWYNSKRGKVAPPQLRCLPYFFLAGVAKCGSTDIYNRLIKHPQVVPASEKEPRWFDWRRHVTKTFVDYLSTFKQAAKVIASDISQHGTSDKVVGDGTPTYIWRNFHWPEYAGNEGCLEPQVVISDTIHGLLPQAKIIFSFRNPVNSLYSKYLSLADQRKSSSPQHFHRLVVKETGWYRRCFARASVRQCAYNVTLSTHSQLRLEKGLYAVFLSDWLRVFPRHQLHIFRFEDYVQDIAGHLKGLFHFLGLKAVPDEKLHHLASLSVYNKGRHYNTGPMLPETRRLLQEFYAPFNAQMAALMNSDKYLWESHE
ncbi:carbohydrate sulfotransferase 15-like isoform X1 [Babylonia areolata]|uniref:carbohydrate sulfotransferase 15-like isoform X1 n=1 Tax=Babylonia areolata TaxID=304850 RepID=UPI003FD01DFA